ncbi:P-loop containing nucleoside triphosphate hydrolase protein [Piedraia hortae CBS 480.64]|uniref:DNA repair protein RAD50 n=1 Tax=Piedraia hortae CBS 480.64 TaxID=1314780 RepID=A0A6A7BTM2_9PEZI|nr:P-loop containing nucleoside triphosphate hydrolase protein [Piedraia hortae CBS 480.64]
MAETTMSSIDKLSILGIRSFDNSRSETIQFHRPLTLITTIIECLKYVTTGELPPNSRSGAFIHDPKICGESEVLAQVKLSFKSIQGARMVCTRNLQLTAKKASRTFKTLEGSILIVKNGEKSTMSSRVAELNSLMPQYLGVSKAILENVIFCHQDESLWPLSAPADLKKRFDEIFEAMKYTKAIDNIKSMQKHHKMNLIGMKKDEEFAQKLSAECDELRAQSEQFDARIKEAAKLAEAAWAKAEQAGMIAGELVGKRIEMRSKEESVQSLREHLEEMSDPDQELQNMLEQYEDRVQRITDDLDASKERYRSLDGEIQAARQKVSAKERECGVHEAEAQHYENQMQTRQQLVKDTARRYNIRGYEGNVDGKKAVAFMNKISTTAREQTAAFERARRETQEALQNAQSALAEINQKKSTLNSQKESARQTISTNDTKIGKLLDHISRITIDESAKFAMVSSQTDIETRLGEFKTKMQTADWDTRLQTEESAQRSLDDRKDALDAELVENTKQARESARLDFVQQELRTREERLDTLTPLLDRRGNELVEAERQRDGVAREAEQVEWKHAAALKDVAAKHMELKDCAAKIWTALGCEPTRYPKEVEMLEEERENYRARSEYNDVLFDYFDECLFWARKEKNQERVCRTCTRVLKDGAEVRNLEQSIEMTKSKVQGDADKTVEDLAAAKAVNRLHGRAISKAQHQRAELSRQRDEHDQEVRQVQGLSHTVQTITKLYGERLSGGETLRDLEQIQEDQKAVADESRARDRVRNQLRDLKEKRTLEDQVEELRSRSNEEQLATLGPQLSQAQERYNDISRRGAERDRQLQHEIDQLNSHEIESYLSRGGLDQVSRGRDEVESLKNAQTEAVDLVRELENQLRNHAETKRSIADNQRYPQLETHNAEADKAHYEAEGGKYQHQRNQLAAEQATVIGSLKSKDETLYKNSAREYKQAHIKVETTKACIEDLSLMKFHSLKMSEINRIIEELWRKTYQGTDVDTILIRSESDPDSKKASSGGKSYNYRVCMVKQDAEMDMRGRCSAGQKVLASIIIRLALAECFGANCGLIALDEPTTNLDRENIRALAESLSEIIRVRKQQRNFQLIVITHDEEFLREMRCADFADVYYRVDRSAEMKSIIERQSIAEVV